MSSRRRCQATPPHLWRHARQCSLDRVKLPLNTVFCGVSLAADEWLR